ncbi:MAG: DUF1178 family protein [Pseudomonadota bacterium]
MIRYALKCGDGHGFEAWFPSTSAFDEQLVAGHVTCPECGSGKVEKALMAPRVANAPRPLSQTNDEREKAIAKIQAEVEKNSEYVGLNFASEARAIHEGDGEARSIYGEAKPEDAKKLIEDGVPVAPLPFVPRAKTN